MAAVERAARGEHVPLWGMGDIGPILDVEEGRAGVGASNAEIASRPGGIARLGDAVRAWAERATALTGREVMLYAGGWLSGLARQHSRELGDRLGCTWLWYASYTAHLTPAAYEPLGFRREQLALWQYAGARPGAVVSRLAGYPATAPVPDVDISAVTAPSGLATLLGGRPTRTQCSTGGPPP